MWGRLPVKPTIDLSWQSGKLTRPSAVVARVLANAPADRQNLMVIPSVDRAAGDAPVGVPALAGRDMNYRLKPELQRFISAAQGINPGLQGKKLDFRPHELLTQILADSRLRPIDSLKIAATL
jgi:hypothetical protein